MVWNGIQNIITINRALRAVRKIEHPHRFEASKTFFEDGKTRHDTYFKLSKKVIPDSS